MLFDRYDNPLSTTSSKARDLYVEAVDRVLSANAGMEQGFEAVVAEDPNFALGYSGLARARQLRANPVGAREALEMALSVASSLPEQEASHLNSMDLLTSGKVPAAYKAMRAHLVEYPRDTMLAHISTGVFGLIGFSGQPGREAELLAYTTSLAPDYGDDLVVP